LRSSFWLDPWFLLMRRSIIAAITVTITTDKFQQFVKIPASCRVFLFVCGEFCLRSAFSRVNADRIY